MANPILIELTRGTRVECRHAGSIAVAKPNGELVLSLGDVTSPVYPRSAVKAFQAIPLLETGAADRFEFGKPEIALACASHSGTEQHVALASSMLARAGLDVTALGCGAHVPMGEEAAAAFHRAGARASALHNNCSGKHSGMVATCVHCGDPVGGYLATDHPHQQRIRGVLEEFTGARLSRDTPGIDGCSAPNWAIPLAGLASAFAQLVTGEGAAKERRLVCERILEASWAAPEMVAGPGRLDTVMMSALPGEIFMKTGAEGVYCGGFPKLGLGFAIKIEDGAKRASEAVTSALASRLLPSAARFAGPWPFKNWVGTTVGETRIAAELAHALDVLAV